MNLLNMNSVPIMVTELLDEEKINFDEYNVLTNLEMLKREPEKAFGTLLSKSSNILENPELNRIKQVKKKYIDSYLNNILGITSNFVLTSSWLTMNHNGAAHERHSHGNVLLSSVLYFCENLSDEPMSDFYISQQGLKHIFKNFQFEFTPNSFNEYNSPSLNIPTKTNLLVIFPGWMLHGSNPMNKNTKRYCIGSNYFLSDHVGTGYHSLSIKAEIKDKYI